MNTQSRRGEILDVLSRASAPVRASDLAAQFGVSRQAIVGDIALLRASGTNVTATPRGYILRAEGGGITHTVACVHRSSDMAAELYTFVDNGCCVQDVIVEHPVYGQITAPLCLASRYDVQQFLAAVENTQPLSSLTDGLHLHTLLCPDEDAYRRVCAALAEKHILLPDEA